MRYLSLMPLRDHVTTTILVRSYNIEHRQSIDKAYSAGGRQL